MTYDEKLEILYDAVENGVSRDEWEDLVDELGLEIHPDSLRKAFNCTEFSGFRVMQHYKDKITGEYCSDDEIKKIEDAKWELQKERYKTQRLNREKGKILRAESDKELSEELIIDAIKNLKPYEIKPTIYKDNQHLQTTAMLIISDAHYGKRFQLNGLFGEVVNKYDTQEFEKRMWKLLSDLENESFNMSFDKLKIVDCGDCVEGILRTGSSLLNLETETNDMAIGYAEFMSIWICECYKRLKVPVEYSLTGGNHDLIRHLASKKDFNDNMAKSIHRHIELRTKIIKLENNVFDDDICIVPYSDTLYHNIYGINIFSYHGDTKNMKEDIEFIENFYNIQVDMLIGGHLHRNSQETIGVADMGDREVIRVPSICGTDDYAKSIKKHSRAGAKIMMFEKDYGKTWERTFYLN